MKRATATLPRLQELRQWMDENDVNQGRLAAYLGRSESMVSRILKGDHDFSLTDMGRLAVWTGLPIAAFDTSGEAQRFIKIYGERLRSGVENVK